MRIAILIEGTTEKVFKARVIEYLKGFLPGRMPKLHFLPYDGRIPKEVKLKKEVDRLLTGREAFDHVVALTDVYTGQSDFVDAQDACAKMSSWVGNEVRFTPCAAQYEFEAWLIPYWDSVKALRGAPRRPNVEQPEKINHGKPPSIWLREAYRSAGGDYLKVRNATQILRDADLGVAVQRCPELKRFINAIITTSGASAIP